LYHPTLATDQQAAEGAYRNASQWFGKRNHRVCGSVIRAGVNEVVEVGGYRVPR